MLHVALSNFRSSVGTFTAKEKAVRSGPNRAKSAPASKNKTIYELLQKYLRTLAGCHRGGVTLGDGLTRDRSSSPRRTRGGISWGWSLVSSTNRHVVVKHDRRKLNMN